MREADFQADFTRYLRSPAARSLPRSSVFELKIWRLDKSKSFRLDSVAPHQLVALALAASDEGLYHRIVDQPFIAGRGFQQKKPFDCLYIRNAAAFIVVWPWRRGERREARRCLFVPLDGWLSLASRLSRAGRKSCRLGELREAGQEVDIWADVKFSASCQNRP